MPNRAQFAFDALWRFMDLAIRVPPLFLLHWHLAEDLSHPLKWQMQQLENSYGVLHFSVLVALVILVIIGVTMTTSQLVLSYSLLTPIILLKWPSLVSIGGEATCPASNLPVGDHPDISFKAFYTWPVLLHLVKDRISSPWQTAVSAPFCYISLVFAGPGVFKFLLASYQWSIYGVLFSPLSAATVASLVLSCGFFWDRHSLATYVIRFRRQARAYCAHERVCRSMCELLKAPQILHLFCLFRVAACALQMMGERYTEETSMTWIAFVEELLVRCCDSTVSVVSLSSVLVQVIDCVILGVRAFLQERDVEGHFKGEMFVLAFSLAYDAEYLLLDRRRSFDRLCQFLCLYAMGRLCCIHQVIEWRLDALRTDASLDPAPQKRRRLLLGCLFVVLSSLRLLFALWDHDTLGPQGAWFMVSGCISMELLSKATVTLATELLFVIETLRGGLWHGFENYLMRARPTQHSLEEMFFVYFMWNSVYGALLLHPEMFCALDVRLFTYVNVWYQEDRCREMRQRERDEAFSKMFPEATAEELLSLDDLCPICFERMQSAIRTKCSHFFHEECLRRWWRVQNSCPVCRSMMHQRSSRSHQ